MYMRLKPSRTFCRVSMRTHPAIINIAIPFWCKQHHHQGKHRGVYCIVHARSHHPSFLHIYHSHIPDDVRLPTHFQCRLEILPKADKKDLIAHPPASQLQSCDSTSAILVVLQHQVQEFDQAHSGDERLTKWLIPTVNVLYAFSAAVSEGVGMVPSPAKVIFAGIGVLL
ncbi:hypothetical protein EDB92DRAFT_1465366 [Lactarius akahatsu]|uniref:Uncharacterized protein n=1 Tax=Lactarius akahatsu TaxID=416441 RepID=A0AAD4QA84_9AGAM|nr:hypothetical protein EDB92DRAFT_1465366 [Lactarius akahatsu]